jgi:hypothetical protein
VLDDQTPRLSPLLREELGKVTPSVDEHGFSYFPCLLVCEDGTVHPRAYVSSRDLYIRMWGDDPSRDYVDIGAVKTLRSSPERLPADLASTVYTYGESGMGSRKFNIIDRMSRRYVCQTGDAVDFVALPPGVTPADIVGVERGGRGDAVDLMGAPYEWCIYRD